MKIYQLLLTSVFLLTACSSVKGIKIRSVPKPAAIIEGSCLNPLAGKNIRITKTMSDSDKPELIFTGKNFFLAWRDSSGRFSAIRTTHINSEGIIQNSSILMPHKKTCRQHALSSDSENIYLSWLEDSKTVAIRPKATPLKTQAYGENVSSFGIGPYGAAAWVEKGSLLFRCDGMLPPPDRSGKIKEPPPLVIVKGGISHPAIAWTGEFFAVVWSESIPSGRRIALQRVTNNGKLMGPKVIISRTDGHARNPVIVWNGHEFAIAWTNRVKEAALSDDKYRVFLATIKKEGISPLLTRQLHFSGSAEQVSLATSGREYALAWVGSKKPAGSAVYFQIIDNKGKAAGKIIRVSDDEPPACGRPSVAWGKNGYAVTWDDSRFFEGVEIFFSFVSCNNKTPENDNAVKNKPASGTQNKSDGKIPEKEELKSIF